MPKWLYVACPLELQWAIEDPGELTRLLHVQREEALKKGTQYVPQTGPGDETRFLVEAPRSMTLRFGRMQAH